MTHDNAEEITEGRPARKRRFSRTGIAFVAIAGIGLLLTLAGGPLWFLGAAFWVPGYCLFAGCGALLCAAAGRKRWMLAGIACAVVSGGMVLSWHIPPAPHPAATDGTALRILTANTWKEPRAAAALVSLILSAQPDIVLIQELGAGWEEILAPLQAMYQYQRMDPRSANGDIHLGIFARMPAESHQQLIAQGIPGTETLFRVRGAPLRVINVHTRSPFSPCRAWLHRQEMEAMARYLRAAEGHVILAGDMNAALWAPLYQRIRRASGLVNARKGFGVLGTWPAWLGPLRTPIDHILLSPQIHVRDCRIGPRIGSDHRPLITDIQLPFEKSPPPLAKYPPSSPNKSAIAQSVERVAVNH